MKNSVYLTLLFWFFCLGGARAQWSLNPDTPTPVADSTGASGSPDVVSDGSGGHYVFWLDNRRGQPYGVYGQRLSATGVRLWPAGGRKIVGGAKQVWGFDVIRHTQGDLILTYNQGAAGGDTLYTCKISPTGAVVWRTLTGCRGQNSVIYVGDPQMINHPTGVYIATDFTYLGGSGGYRYQSVDLAGNRKFGKANGQAIPGSYGGPFTLLPGPRNGGLLIWRNSNGTGTHASARRFNADSTLVGTANVDIVAGTTGLNYAIHPVSDGKGGAFFAYVGNTNGKSINLCHIDTSLQHTFRPRPIPICSLSTSSGDNPYVYVKNTEVYVVWADNRPPAANADVYMQAVDSASGDVDWATNGVQVIRKNSYIPYPKIVAADSGGLFVLSHTTSADDFFVQRMKENGTKAFSGYRFLDRSYEPFYAEYRLVETGGVPLIFWRSGSRVYAKPIAPYLPVANQPTLTSRLSLSPNPSSGMLRVEAAGQKLGTFHIHDATGRLMLVAPAAETVDISLLRPGLYTLSTEMGNGTARMRFVRE